jgi:FkbM family methyltransferase
MAVEARKLSEQLGLTGTHVFFNDGWVPYEDRQNYLLEADIAVRARILDYLWAGLPVVASTGDFSGDLVAREDLGAAVPPGDVDALESALLRLLSDDESRLGCASRAAAVGARFSWSTTLQPLVEFCRQPQRAPDFVSVDIGSAEPATSVSVRPRHRAVDNLRIALDHLEEGGVRQVIDETARRLQRRARWHPAAAQLLSMREQARSHPGLAVQATARIESTGARRLADLIDHVIWDGDVVVVSPPDVNGVTSRLKMHERHGADQIVRAVRRDGWRGFECPLPDVFYRCVQATEGLVLDIGANTGFYALLAAIARRDVRVIAFEPFPPVAAMLRQNLWINPRGSCVTVVDKAVSDKDGTATLFVPETTTGLVETSSSLNSQFKYDHSTSIEVDVTMVDTYVARLGHPPVSVVKIDVESAEDAVLRGCRQTLRRDRPIVFVEFLQATGNDEAMERLRVELDLIDIRLRPTEAVVAPSIAFDANAWNHLLCPAERFSEVTTLLANAHLCVVTADR